MFDRATMELNVEPLILGALREDITSEDVSTNCIMRDKCPGNVELICKQDGVICGLQVFERVFTLLDPETEVVTYVKDGDKVEKGQKLPDIPEGATPKDGPSAGVTMCTALFSLLSGKKVRRDIAMTGEITLQGNILPVGGIKEKVLAAYRQGIRKILLPKDNAADIEEIPKSVRSRLEFVLLEKAEDAFREVLISEESEKEN